MKQYVYGPGMDELVLLDDYGQVCRGLDMVDPSPECDLGAPIPNTGLGALPVVGWVVGDVVVESVNASFLLPARCFDDQMNVVALSIDTSALVEGCEDSPCGIGSTTGLNRW